MESLNLLAQPSSNIPAGFLLKPFYCKVEIQHLVDNWEFWLI